MTRDEAIERIKEIKDRAWGWHINGEVIGIDYGEFIEIMETAFTALRPVSREQVEKVWRAHWRESTQLGGFVYCSHCGYSALEANNYTFCPKCGSPFTDEAVEMVMERMEEM